MKGPLLDKSMDFAIDIVNIYKEIKDKRKEKTLSFQMLRSGTSIGANIAECDGTESDSDFVHKFSVALKECNETRYWLELLYKTEYIDEKKYYELNGKCLEIRKMLVASIRTKKMNMK